MRHEYTGTALLCMILSCVCVDEEPKWEERLLLPDPGMALIIQEYAQDWGIGILVDAGPEMIENNIWITTKLCHGVPPGLLDDIGRCPLNYVDAACVPNGFPDHFGKEVSGSNLFINMYMYRNLTGLMKRLLVVHEIGHCLGFVHSESLMHVMHHTSPNFVSDEEKEAARKAYLEGGSLPAALSTGMMSHYNRNWTRFRVITP